MLDFSLLRIPTIKQALTGTLLLLALALFMMPQAMACHKGDPPKPHGKNSTCDPVPGPGPVPGPTPNPEPSTVDTMLALTGNEVSGQSADGWRCVPGGPFTYEVGNYACDDDPNPVTLNASGGSSTLVYANKHASICSALWNGITLTPDSGGLSYGWTDGCNANDDSDFTCAVEVRAVFSDGPVGVNGQTISEFTGGKAKVLDVVMHGWVDTKNSLVPDSNPFFNERTIQITSMDFDFRGRRSAALCTLHVPHEDNTLISIPD